MYKLVPVDDEINKKIKDLEELQAFTEFVGEDDKGTNELKKQKDRLEL